MDSKWLDILGRFRTQLWWFLLGGLVFLIHFNSTNSEWGPTCDLFKMTFKKRATGVLLVSLRAVFRILGASDVFSQKYRRQTNSSITTLLTIRSGDARDPRKLKFPAILRSSLVISTFSLRKFSSWAHFFFGHQLKFQKRSIATID